MWSRRSLFKGFFGLYFRAHCLREAGPEVHRSRAVFEEIARTGLAKLDKSLVEAIEAVLIQARAKRDQYLRSAMAKWLLRNLLRPLVTPKRSHGKRYPTENKTKSAYRGNRTQPASTAECHQVKATGEYEYSNRKQPTRRIDPIAWPTSCCPGNGE